MESLSRLRLGQSAKVTRAEDAVTVEVFDRGVRREALRVSCDAIATPIADEVESPADKRPSVTKVVAGVIVSRTQGGALSLDFPAGMLDLEGVHVVVMFDDSVSLVRGERVFYGYARHADGTVVETEGVGNGCGCERTTRPDGTVSVRRLE
jgi:hypothetical protein